MKRSIRREIFFSFSGLVLVFTVCVAAIILQTTSSELLKRTQTEALVQADLVVRGIDDSLDSMRSAYVSCVTDRSVFTEVEKSNGIQSSYTYTINLLRAFTFNDKFLSSIYLFDVKNQRLINTKYSSPGYLGGHSWLTEYGTGDADFVIVSDSEYPFDAGKELNMLAYCGPLRYNYFGATVGYVSVNASLSELKDRLYPKAEKGVQQYILDGGGSVVFGGVMSGGVSSCVFGMAEDGAVPAEVDGVSSLVIVSTSSKYGWKFVRIVPQSIIYSGVTNTVTLLVAITAAFLAIGVLLSYLLARGFTEPIYELKRRMVSYRNGDSRAEPARKNSLLMNDDFRELFVSYDEMVSRMDHLIDEVYRANLNKKEMEIRMLQAGINPHFIYNVMDSINWLLKMQEYDKAGKVLTVFSRYLRQTLSFHRDSITVRELKNQIETYCELQKFFSDDRISYRVDFTEELLDRSVMTLLLQPVVENAYKHGFPDHTRSGLIRISGEAQGRDAVFTVRDDGAGIGAAKLAEVRAAILSDGIRENEDFFGLHSVARRIRFSCGAGYGLEIGSEEGTGTTVKIKTKIVEEMQK